MTTSKVTSQLVKAAYDYDADPTDDGKVLSCAIGERYIVIKSTKPQDWLYVVNCKGRLGYIPANFVQNDELGDTQYLEFIDSVVALLEKKPNNDLITVRQINHAQVKLTQLRCEIVQRIYGNAGPSPEIIFIPNSSEPPIDPRTISPLHAASKKTEETECEVLRESPRNPRKKRVSFSTEVEEVPPAIGYEDEGTQTEEIADRVEARKLSLPIGDGDIAPPESLVMELIERVRVSSELSHEMCKNTVEVLIDCLGEMIPGWQRKCNQIKQQLNSVDRTLATPDALLLSSDAQNLKAIFNKLWSCKNDEQQRSWPVHEDEGLIQQNLQELTKILANANPVVCREIIARNSYDNVHMLVTYFQMETRRSLRMELFAVLLEIIRLAEAVIPDYLLSSVLPAALADELVNYKTDAERWRSAALVFTVLFGTGHKPPINLYDHVNEHFVSQLVDVIEGEDAAGNKVDTSVPLETSIPALLSFNLQFTNRESNFVLKALSVRPNASQLTENLVSYLNWEEDPTRAQNILGESSFERPNSVHKLLIEIFDEADTAKLFYYNDVRVLIDIVITHLNNLLAGDKDRISYLKLSESIIEHTIYKEEPHKLQEMVKCLDGIENHECSTEAETQLARQVRALLPRDGLQQLESEVETREEPTSQ